MVNGAADIPQLIKYSLGLLVCLIIFFIAYSGLKPHRLHHSRPISTFALKASYLIYLMVASVILLFAYMSRGGFYSRFPGIQFFVLLIIMFVPTVAIFSRKVSSFSRHRVRFNIFFTIINLAMAIILLLIYFI